MQNPDYLDGLRGKRGTYTDINSIPYRTGVRDRAAIQKPLFTFTPPKPIETVYTPRSVPRASSPAHIASAAGRGHISPTTFHVDTDDVDCTGGSTHTNDLSEAVLVLAGLLFYLIVGGLAYGAYRYFSAPDDKPAVVLNPRAVGQRSHHNHSRAAIKRHSTGELAAASTGNHAKQLSGALAEIPDAAPSPSVAMPRTASAGHSAKQLAWPLNEIPDAAPSPSVAVPAPFALPASGQSKP